MASIVAGVPKGQQTALKHGEIGAKGPFPSLQPPLSHSWAGDRWLTGCLLGVSRSMQDTVKEECEAEQAERKGGRKAGEEEAHSLRCIPYSQSPAPLTMRKNSRKSWRRKKTFIFIPTLPSWEGKGKPTHVDQWAVMVLGLILCLPPHPRLPEVQDVDTELSATHTRRR